jgi:hypothetical protein
VSGKPIENVAALPADIEELLAVLARDTAAAAADKKR